MSTQYTAKTKIPQGAPKSDCGTVMASTRLAQSSIIVRLVPDHPAFPERRPGEPETITPRGELEAGKGVVGDGAELIDPSSLVMITEVGLSKVGIPLE